MAFDITGARSDGVSDEQIKDLFRDSFDVDQALSDGVSLEQIAEVIEFKPPETSIFGAGEITPIEEPAEKRRPGATRTFEEPIIPEIEAAPAVTTGIEEPAKGLERKEKKEKRNYSWSTREKEKKKNLKFFCFKFIYILHKHRISISQKRKFEKKLRYFRQRPGKLWDIFQKRPFCFP